MEFPVEGMRDYPGESGLAYSGRSPEYERGQIARVDHIPQYASFPDQMPLSYILVKGLRPHPLRQRGKHPVHYCIVCHCHNFQFRPECLPEAAITGHDWQSYDIFVKFAAAKRTWICLRRRQR